MALDSLQDVNGEQAAYLRGFAYLQQKHWQKADKEWKSVKSANVQQQRQQIKALAQADKVFTFNKIQELVTQEKLEEAKLLSQEFIDKFGVDPIVEQNLDKHIQPRLEAQIWAMGNWDKIARATEKKWLETQNAQSLHNWAIATYYQARKYPDQLPNFIIAWSTALANLEINPCLKDISWLGSRTISLETVSEQLHKILETLIEGVKDNNIEQYFHLRDLHRQEKLALSLMGNTPSCGVRVKGLFITPGCYQYYRNHLPNIDFPTKPWGALYTDWGKAVAACLSGDIDRAIQIKPRRSKSPVENFAQVLVSYHAGCYYLKQEIWREAIYSLRQAQTEIKANCDWTQEIENLCQLQSKKIASENLEDNLDLAEFWFQISESQTAKIYLATWRTQKVMQRLWNGEINYRQARSDLQKISPLDPNNPTVSYYIGRLQQEIDRII